MKRVFSIISLCIAATIAADAQDLGSSNRLFGGAKPSASAPLSGKKPTSKPGKKVSSKAKPKAADASSGRRISAKKVNPSRRPAGKIKRNELAAIPTVDIRNEAREREYEEMLAAATSAADKQDYPAAELAFANAKRIRDNDARMFAGLGAFLAAQQRWAEAEDAFRSALRLSPADSAAKLALSKLLLRPLPITGLGDRYEEAKKLAESVVEAEPNNAAAHDQLGNAMETLGYVGPATEREYMRAIELDNSNYLAFAHLGRMMKTAGKTRESATFYGDAITRAATAPALVSVAEVLQSELRFGESAQLLKRAAVMSPKYAAGLNLLGKALIAIGEFAEAENVLRRSITAAPHGHIPYLLLADLHLRKVDLRMSETYLQQGARFAFNNDRIAFAERFERIADQYSGRGIISEANRCYRLALTFEPDRDSVLRKLANRN